MFSTPIAGEMKFGESKTFFHCVGDLSYVFFIALRRQTNDDPDAFALCTFISLLDIIKSQ